MARRAKGPDGNGGSADDRGQKDGIDLQELRIGIGRSISADRVKVDPYNVKAADITAEMIAGADRSAVQVYRETLHDRLGQLSREAGRLCEPGTPDSAKARWKEENLEAKEGGALVLAAIRRVRALTEQCRKALQPPELKGNGSSKRGGSNGAGARSGQGLEKLAGIVNADVGRDPDKERLVLCEEVFRGRVGMENED